MHGRGRLSEAAVRNAERRRREDEAPRLRDRVPRLESLRLEIAERRQGGIEPDVTHVKRVVVDSAAAMFELSCCDRSCKEGGHDITRMIMAELERGAEKFEGEDACHGSLGTAPCGRVLHFVGIATYRD
jgi:hypothetical protein